MKLFRTIGCNIKNSLNLSEMPVEDFAKALQTDVGTAHKIMDGRKTLSEGELQKIASVLHCSSMDLMMESLQNSCLPGAKFRGEFKDPEHIETFLNLVDAYMDCQELRQRMHQS